MDSRLAARRYRPRRVRRLVLNAHSAPCLCPSYSNVATFENALRKIGEELKIRGIDRDDKVDVKSLVMKELSNSKGYWLLLVDNMDDLDFLTELRDYLPFSHKGSILFTTRNHAAAQKLGIQATHNISIETMSRSEATETLHKNLRPGQRRDSQNDPKSTTKLLDLLADLPLAIKQASAYMHRTDITVAKYLGHCQSSDTKLIKLFSEDFDDLGRYTGTSNPIATTWLISFQHISQHEPLAAQHLQFMSLLGEKDIPKSLLPPSEDELAAYEAAAVLKGYGFIVENEDRTTYQMHRLVRLAMRNWLETKNALNACANRVIRRLDEIFPSPTYKNKGDWVRYLPHAVAVLEVRASTADSINKYRLLHNVGNSYFYLRKYEQCEKIFWQALELSPIVFGAGDVNTLGCMHQVAQALYIRKEYGAAENIYRQSLQLCAQALGPEHRYTIRSKFGLASVFHSRKEFKKAESMYQQTLALCTTAFEPNDPFTLQVKRCVASVLSFQGQYEQAEAMHWEVFNLRSQILGPDDRSTLKSKISIANTVYSQGKYGTAENMYREAWKVCTKEFGLENILTIDSKRNLQMALAAQGKPSQE